MNYLDTLYRALIDYRKNTLENNECKVQRDAIIAADSENDRIEVTRKNCIVEEDWIEAIERGLEFIEKAINEERQFIRSNGEVIPIEKVKRVSRDSVEHLARHSNYFTREQEEGKDLIPDQLYTVERLSDYAVYENRFLYMLLCYLRDFIAIRYEKIVEVTNTYNGSMTMNKNVVESNRKVQFEIRLAEEKKNDEYLRSHNAAQQEIDRMLTIYNAVMVYLNTPLMIEVAKSPMIKPPIQRTNVLKKNRNFREVLALYEYVTAYDKDGYTIHTESRILSPFNGVVAEELSEMVDLSLFLTYEHGLGIREYFKKNYEKEEARRREEERKKLAEKIQNVSRHLKASGMTPEEYILLLEKRIRDLEKVEEELEIARKTIKTLEENLANLRTELETAQDMVRSLGEEITRLNKKYADDMAEAQHAFNVRINELTNEYEDKINRLNIEHENEKRLLNEQHAKEREILETEHEETIKTLQAEHEETVRTLNEEKRLAEEEYHRSLEAAREEYNEAIKSVNEEYAKNSQELTEKIAAGVEKISELNARYIELEKKKTLADARLNALRSEHGLMTAADDFTSKEMIDELEHQYKVFVEFFEKEWGKTKKKWLRRCGKRSLAKKAKSKKQKVTRINHEHRKQKQIT